MVKKNIAKPDTLLATIQPRKYEDASTAIQAMKGLITSLQTPPKDGSSTPTRNARFTNTLSQMHNITTRLKNLTSMKSFLHHAGINHGFLFFPKLPAELREMIWNFAMPRNQILEVGWTTTSYMFRSHIPRVKGHKLPVTLAVCHESRQQLSNITSMILVSNVPRNHS